MSPRAKKYIKRGLITLLALTGVSIVGIIGLVLWMAAAFVDGGGMMRSECEKFYSERGFYYEECETFMREKGLL